MSEATSAPDLLCAALLKVRARAAGLLPAFWGTLVQGAWLRWVEEVDPALSARLHAENQERPYTCSALWLPDRPEQIRLQEAGQRLAVQQGQICWLRLTLLDGMLFNSFARQTLASAESGPASVPPLELNGIPFDLLEMVVDDRASAGEASWSGWTGYRRLREQSQGRSDRRLEWLTLEFDAPTAFGGVDRPWGREPLCCRSRCASLEDWRGAGSVLRQKVWQRPSSRRRSRAIWRSVCAWRSTRCARSGCTCARRSLWALWGAVRICCRPMMRATACAARSTCWRTTLSTRAWATRRHRGWGAHEDWRDSKTAQR
jgi:hypothetical protein